MGRTRGKPRSTRLSRFIQGRRLDHNPLRRGSDRAETAILAALVAAFLAGAPFAAQATGAWTHSALQREQAAQESSWHQVPAVLLTAATTGVRVSDVAPGPQAKARWIAPNGATIISSIPVTSGGQPGNTVRIWVARDGGLTQQPLMDSQVSSEVGCAEAGAVAALAVTLAAVGFLGRRSLDKRRLAAWDTEWRSAGPSSTRA
ncbi:MAG TPA: hypothetical protein VF060_08335 [Trebonia sp.]